MGYFMEECFSEKTAKYGVEICQKICALTDELRDLWLCQQSKAKIRNFMELSVSQGRLLRAVWRMSDCGSRSGVSLRELAGRLGLSSSAVSVAVENLVQRGYLERQVSANDRRKVNIRVSGKALVRRREYERFLSDNISNFFAGSDSEKLCCLKEFLDDFNKFLTDKKGE